MPEPQVLVILYTACASDIILSYYLWCSVEVAIKSKQALYVSYLPKGKVVYVSLYVYHIRGGSGLCSGEGGGGVKAKYIVCKACVQNFGPRT